MTLEVSLSHRFGAFHLDVDFTAPEGITALFGRSGSGKTSIVNAVAGLLAPDAGRVRVSGRTLLDTSKGVFQPPHRRNLGYVFQEGRLFPHLSVRQNLAYGRFFRGARTETDKITDHLGLGGMLDRRPLALSGGEKQRVAIGRALLSAPDMLLMDEPLAALDSGRKREILPYIQRLHEELGIPILYISHSIPEIARIATTVVAVEAGRVERAGPAREILADPDVAPALGIRDAGAVISGRLSGHDEDGISSFDFRGGTLLLPRQDDPVGTALTVRIEAKDVLLARTKPDEISALNVLEGSILQIRRGDGPGVLVQMQVGEELLLSRITRRSADRLSLQAGQTCFAVLKSVSIAKQDIG